jgi:hypothetical protein
MGIFTSIVLAIAALGVVQVVVIICIMNVAKKVNRLEDYHEGVGTYDTQHWK